MNYSKIIVVIIFCLVACGKTKKTNESKVDSSGNPNQVLYEQVMSIHDEVMPKSDQLYQLKEKIKEKLKDENLSDEAKQEFTQTIHELDSANHSMMDWMHHFDPLPDSANSEAAHEYLEDEMEKIKKVRDLINNTIQKTKEELSKK